MNHELAKAFGATREEAIELRERLRAQALRLGFSRCGFASAEPLGEVAERRWKAWLGEGRAGVMAWLEREFPRRTWPEDLLPGAKTAIVVMAGYFDGDHSGENQIRNSKLEIRNNFEVQNSNEQNGNPKTDISGKIARYAWGKDYHLVMREKLGELGAWLEAEVLGRAAGAREMVQWRACVDSAPLDERGLAARAGLGFIGKNTLLLTPDAGSWGLIGVLLTTLELPVDAPLAPAPQHSCGSCRKCIEACPTGAIDAPYRVDARRCLSYLTIERKEEIPEEYATKMNGWVFGCDICQEVCPYNAAPLARLLPELAASAGAGKYFDEKKLGEMPTGKSFLKRWKETPLARVGLKGMLKNFRGLCRSLDRDGRGIQKNGGQ